MIDLDFNNFEKWEQKAQIKPGNYEVTLTGIKPHNTGVDLVLEVSKEFFPYRFRLYNHTDGARKFTNDFLCNSILNLGLPRAANITALVGKKFNITLDLNEAGYITHKGLPVPIKSNATPGVNLNLNPVVIKPTAPPPSPPAVPSVSIPQPSAPVVPGVSTEEKRYSNGHTRNELLAAGWTSEEVDSLDTDDFDNDIPY